MRATSPHAARFAAMLVLATLAACSSADRPPLPRRARIDTAETTLPADELRHIVERADILYLPADRLESAGHNSAIFRLLGILQQSAAHAAVCWANIAADLAPIFQEWNSGEIGLDEFVERIRFASASQREAVRRLLRESREERLVSVPVNCSAGLTCIAENIVREHRALEGGKLLVIIDRRDLDSAVGVPAFVGQRLQVRQVVLDARPGDNRPTLLTSAGSPAEIVDATPRAGRDRR